MRNAGRSTCTPPPAPSWRGSSACMVPERTSSATTTSAGTAAATLTASPARRFPSRRRIIAVADVYDAMTSDRPYRARSLHEVAISELVRGGGSQFDARIVGRFSPSNRCTPVRARRRRSTALEHLTRSGGSLRAASSRLTARRTATSAALSPPPRPPRSVDPARATHSPLRRRRDKRLKSRGSRLRLRA